MGESAVERTRTTAQAQAEGLRVFVAGIPWKLTQETIRRDFEECGIIEDLFLQRDGDGNSRGRAFITYRDKAAVEAALKFDNTDYGGRKIYVQVASGPKREAKEAPQKPQQQSEKFLESKPEGCMSICIKNIGEASEFHVRKLLKGCDIQSIRTVTDRKTGKPRGIAFVDFRPGFDVDEAMKLNGEDLQGQKVQMSYEKPRDRPRPEGCFTIAIKKLPATTVETDIKKLLEGLESLTKVRLIRKDGVCSGLAFAKFDDAEDVVAAVKRDGMKVNGEVVFICYETKPSKREQAKDEAIAKAKEKGEKGLPPKGTPNASPEGDGAKRKKKKRNGAQETEQHEPKKGGKKRKKDDAKEGEKADKEDQEGTEGPQETEQHEPKKGGKKRKNDNAKEAEKVDKDDPEVIEGTQEGECEGEEEQKDSSSAKAKKPKKKRKKDMEGEEAGESEKRQVKDGCAKMKKKKKKLKSTGDKLVEGVAKASGSKPKRKKRRVASG